MISKSICNAGYILIGVVVGYYVATYEINNYSLFDSRYLRTRLYNGDIDQRNVVYNVALEFQPKPDEKQ